MQIPLAQKSNGMYLFSSKDFDGVAELVLREYAPYMLEKAQPLDIEALADEPAEFWSANRPVTETSSLMRTATTIEIMIAIP